MSLCDKHIPKMIVESAQLLSTAHRMLDGTQYEGKTVSGRKVKRWKLNDPINDEEIYEATFVNHPCTIWTRSCSGNYLWLARHADAMCEEFKCRFKHSHKTHPLIQFFLNNIPKNILISSLETFALAMPDEFKNFNDPVESYRSYYIHAKAKFAKWEKVPNRMPNWFWLGCKQHNIPILNEPAADATAWLQLTHNFNKP